MGVEMYIMTVVLLLTDLVCRFMLRKNLYRLYMKKENGRVQLAEIKRWRGVYYTRPVLYEVVVEYAVGDEKKRMLLTTSSSFLKKYRNEKYIQIVTIPGTDLVFLAEEKWRVQNIELRFVIILLSIVEVTLMLIGFLEACSRGMLHCIIFLLCLFTFLYLRYTVGPRTRYKHKTRMKFVTELACEKIIEKISHEAQNDFHFVKAKEDIKDKMYLFSIDCKALFYRGFFRAEARYNVLVTPSQAGSTVWFYLSQCSDDYALDRFAGRLIEFMEKKIGAFREE